MPKMEAYFETKSSAVPSELNDSFAAANEERDLRLAQEFQDLIDGKMEGRQHTSLLSRSIRIGSYKSLPKENVYFTEKAIKITVPTIADPNEMVSLILPIGDIMKIQANFGRTIPVFFIMTSPACCAKFRNILKMNKSTGLWFDNASPDETMKRLTILPEKIHEDHKTIVSRLYGSLIEDIDAKVANDILVKSSPKDNKMRALPINSPLPMNSQGFPRKPPGLNYQLPINEKYCQFPPTGNNTITVQTEDYFCLEDESFLNDVIIDFYLKWIQFKQISEVDRDRTHIFSTYFYERLTMRTKTPRNKPHPTEDDNSLTAAEKRYDRVKRWTKNVNIFDKDFIVVPINEHSHWFVAVICFPGLEGCQHFETGEPCEMPDKQKRAEEQAATRSKRNKAKKKEMVDKKVLQIGSTSIIPLKNSTGGFTNKITVSDDMSDKDEASGSDDDLLEEEETMASIIAGLKQKAASLKAREEGPPSEAPSPKDSKAEEDNGDKTGDDAKAANSPKESSMVNGGESDKVPPEVESAPSKTNQEGTTETIDNPKKGENTESASSKPNVGDPKAKPVETGSKMDVDEPKPDENGSKVIAAQVDGSDLRGRSSGRSSPTPGSPRPDLKPAEEAESTKEPPKQHVKIKQPCILIFDSLHTGSRAKVAATLRDYLKCEYKSKMGKTREFSKETLRGCCPKVPQQPNFSDCGIFVLQYIESFFKSPLDDFCLPVTNLKNWFQNDSVRNKRSQVANIIRDLAAEQNPNKKFDFPPLTFTPDCGSGYTDDEEISDEDGNMMKRPAATLIKLGSKSSTPTKVLTTTTVTPMGASQGQRFLCLPGTSSSLSVTSTRMSNNGQPQLNQPGLIIFKKGKTIDISSGTIPSKLLVPRITKSLPTNPNLQRETVGSSSDASESMPKAPSPKVDEAKAESPDSATDLEPSTTMSTASPAGPQPATVINQVSGIPPPVGQANGDQDMEVTTNGSPSSSSKGLKRPESTPSDLEAVHSAKKQKLEGSGT